MALTGQNHGVYRSKVWHFWVVTHGVLATPDNGLWLRQTTRLLLRETTDNRQRSCGSRWSFAGATSDYGLQTTDYGLRRAVTGGASPELRNHGLTELWIYGIMELRIGQSRLTAHDSQLTTNCGHALTLRCLLSVDCCP